MIDWFSFSPSKAVLYGGKRHGSQALPSVSEWSTTIWRRLNTPRSPSTFAQFKTLNGKNPNALKASRLRHQGRSVSNELKTGKNQFNT